MKPAKSKKLDFFWGNGKLAPYIAHVSLPAGHSCPGANLCLSRANKSTGKLKDGPLCQFRCYAASQEAVYPNLRDSRWRNFKLIKSKRKSKFDLVELINSSLPKNAPIIRIHVGGDFFTQEYFDAWIEVAKMNPSTIFYAYTKSLNFWSNRIGFIPSNLKLNASKGGKFDYLIEKLNLKFAEVVYSEQEAKEKGLVFNHKDEDSLAYSQEKSFALLLHGTQPAGTEASKAWQKIRKTIGGYSSKNKN